MAEIPALPFSTPSYREMDFRVDAEELAARAAARAVARAAAKAAREARLYAMQGDGGGDDGDGPDVEDAADAMDDLIPVAISSERAVMREDYMTGDRYMEVLDHAPSSVDLSYARDGLPFVMSHRAGDGDAQHGIVENVRVGVDRVLRGDLRMSRAQRSQEIGQDIRDGIRKKVSVGYLTGNSYDTTDNADGVATRRYRAWMPLEVSSVPIPADYSVGIGRSAVSGDALPHHLADAIRAFVERHQPTPKAVQAEERTMSEHASAAPAAVTVGAEAASERVKNIASLAREHAMTDKLPDWIAAGASEVEVSRAISTELQARIKRGPQVSAGVEVDMNEKRDFFISRALVEGAGLSREFGVDTGFEREVMAEARKGSPSKAGGAGAFVPNIIKRAGIDSATATTGGPFKFTQPGSFIEVLRNKLAVARLGATFMTGLTGPVSFPRQTAAGSVSWIGENPGSDTSDSNLTSDTVTLAFKTLMTTTSVSRQALFSAASGNYDLEAIIRDDMAAIIALGVDLAAISGSGASNQPLGILSNTNVGTATALGTNGGTMAWNNWVDLETSIANNNADLPGLGYLTNTKQRGTARKKAVLDQTATGIPIWGTAPDMEGVVNGYRAVASNQVSSTLTKGTATTVCSAVIFGAWPQLMVGQFGNGYEVLVDPLRLKKQAMIELTAYTFADVAIRQPKAFATIVDALTY